MREVDKTNGIPALIADLGMMGVWQPQSEVLPDIHVIDIDA